LAGSAFLSFFFSFPFSIYFVFPFFIFMLTCIFFYYSSTSS
jgi:hypothetical protein